MEGHKYTKRYEHRQDNSQGTRQDGRRNHRLDSNTFIKQKKLAGIKALVCGVPCGENSRHQKKFKMAIKINGGTKGEGSEAKRVVVAKEGGCGRGAVG